MIGYESTDTVEGVLALLRAKASDEPHSRRVQPEQLLGTDEHLTAEELANRDQDFSTHRESNPRPETAA